MRIPKPGTKAAKDFKVVIHWIPISKEEQKWRMKRLSEIFTRAALRRIKEERQQVNPVQLKLF